MADRRQIADMLASMLETIVANPALLTPQVEGMLGQVIQEVTNWMQGPGAEQAQEAAQIQSQAVSREGANEAASLLWYLAGGDTQAFMNYLSQFPDPDTQALLRNPQQLQQIIQQLQSQPLEPPQVVDGVPEAELNSSNVFGFKYDPRTQKLVVKFNGKDIKSRGPLYQYDGVPPMIAELFMTGAIPAKTKGRNKHGSWFKNKMPSLGAAAHQLLKLGGYNYQRLS